MSHRRTALTATVVMVGAAALTLSACGKSATSSDESSSAAPAGSSAAAASEAPASEPAVAGLATTTPAGTTPLESVTWSVYRDVAILDPIYVFDYPDNAAVSLLCESLSKQLPDGTLVDGLATLDRPDELTMVYTINPAATFWDGSSVTADDVVFSLQKQMTPELGGFYGLVFANVKSVTATAADEVTIALTAPDYSIQGELASIPGLVVQKAYAEAAGAAFGTPDKGVMCSGSYTNSGWTVGEGLTVTRNENYWNTSVKPVTESIRLIGTPDPNALAAGLISGDLDGTYWTGGTTGALAQMADNGNVTITEGASFAIDAFITATGNGVLTDPEVRKALSLAIDRQPYIDAVWEGKADVPKALAPPATWGYGRTVFEEGYAALPDATQDLEAAKALVAGKGLEGKKIVIGLVQVPSMSAEANAVKEAAEALGLEVELKAIPADSYINLFIDPEFRKGVDGWFTVNYPDYADPMSLLAGLATPGAPQNYNEYSNPAVTEALAAARSTQDENERAALVVEAQRIIMEEMPWIPMSFPNNVSITSKEISGQTASFTYMFSPWADTLGGVG